MEAVRPIRRKAACRDTRAVTAYRRPARPRKPTKTEQQTALVIVGAVALGAMLICGVVSQLLTGGDSDKSEPARPRPPAVATTRPAVTSSPTVRPEHTYLFLPPDAPIPSGAGVPEVPDPAGGDDEDTQPEEPADEDEGVYYANCAAARRAGAAPIYRGEPGYRRGLDRDNDGVACDR